MAVAGMDPLNTLNTYEIEIFPDDNIHRSPFIFNVRIVKCSFGRVFEGIRQRRNNYDLPG